MNLTRRYAAMGVFALLSAFSMPPQALGADYTWNNPVTSGLDWNNAANWLPASPAGFPNGTDAVANINIDFTNSVSIRLSGSPTVRTLNLGDANGTSPISFSGGSGGLTLTMQSSTGTASINKLQGGVDTFARVVNLAASVTNMNVTAGALTFSTGWSGTGNLNITGANKAAVNVTGTVTSSYTGKVSVGTGGTLMVTGTVASSSAVVEVTNQGTLKGTGLISRATTISSGGTLAPGASPGILNFSAGLSLSNDSQFIFELNSNTVAGRGTNYDGINVTAGTLTIADGADFNMVLNGAGSTTDYTAVFWDTAQEWLVFDNASAPTIASLNIFNLGTIGNDSLGNAFSVTGGSFDFELRDNDVYLVYSTVPEPSTTALLSGVGLGFVLFGLKRARRRFGN